MSFSSITVTIFFRHPLRWKQTDIFSWPESKYLLCEHIMVYFYFLNSFKFIPGNFSVVFKKGGEISKTTLIFRGELSTSRSEKQTYSFLSGGRGYKTRSMSNRELTRRKYFDRANYKKDFLCKPVCLGMCSPTQR